MRIIRAEHYGMCFGVRDAIALALKQAREQPLTVLGELVHNQTVLQRLQEKGIGIAQEAAQVNTPTAMITAHGASEKARQRALRLGLELRDATCPLVKLAHRAVARLEREGFYPVIVGKRDHVEVRGLTEDLKECSIVLKEEEMRNVPERPRYGVAAQTTQPIDHVRRMAAVLRARFPDAEVRLVDTVCQPTKQRQHAALELAHQCDVIIVVGGANSNNTRELVSTCSTLCHRVHHVQTAADLEPQWFQGQDTVGITAGTSTPDDVIDRVEHWIRERFVSEETAAAEPLAVHA